MKPVGFENLAGLPLVSYYEEAFRKATGVSLKLVAPDDAKPGCGFGPFCNPFCSLAGQTSSGCNACVQTTNRLKHGVARKLVQQQISCYSGLTVVAVPLLVAGQHVATLMTGQVFRREPTERDFGMVVKILGQDSNVDWQRKARQAYFATPVVTAERFQAILHLLNVFAQFLAEFAGRLTLARADEPKAVATAKEFVKSHADEQITLEQVVEHVHVSRYYFCKLFKKATGMTLTEYVARVRVEKAKTLLFDPGLRISEVVYAAGFGSIPRFNTVFKRYAGMAPTQYRAALKSQAPG